MNNNELLTKNGYKYEFVSTGEAFSGEVEKILFAPDGHSTSQHDALDAIYLATGEGDKWTAQRVAEKSASLAFDRVVDLANNLSKVAEQAEAAATRGSLTSETIKRAEALLTEAHRRAENPDMDDYRRKCAGEYIASMEHKIARLQEMAELSAAIAADTVISTTVCPLTSAEIAETDGVWQTSLGAERVVWGAPDIIHRLWFEQYTSSPDESRRIVRGHAEAWGYGDEYRQFMIGALGLAQIIAAAGMDIAPAEVEAQRAAALDDWVNGPSLF